MRAIDFFCGAGGLTRGLGSSGIEVVAGIDADGTCRESFEHNNRKTEFHESSIESVRGTDLWKALKSRAASDLIFAGCAPCQPFSAQKKTKAESRSSSRDALLLGEFARLVEECLPGFIVIENVPGLARVKGFSTYRRFTTMLQSKGYNFVQGVIDAKDYGVPQNRRRFILIASRRHTVSMPPKSHGISNRPHLTVRAAIEHFPAIEAGESHPIITNHQAAAISELNMLRLRSTPLDGGDRRSWPSDLILECHKGRYEGHTDVYGRMAWDKPAPTLTGKCHSISNGRYGHPEQHRAISLREAASLQTFPDAYRFFGNQGAVAQQIGNAVPVSLGRAIGSHLLGIESN